MIVGAMAKTLFPAGFPTILEWQMNENLACFHDAISVALYSIAASILSSAAGHTDNAHKTGFQRHGNFVLGHHLNPLVGPD
jgi:hypothetical protein